MVPRKKDWLRAAAIAALAAGLSCERTPEVPVEPLPEIPRPTNLSGILGAEGVQLFWEYDSTYVYGGFSVERSEDDQATWFEVATVDAPPFTDTNLRSQFTYWYRVSGLSPEGLKGPASPPWPAQPAVYEVLIEDGDAVTNRQQVVLTFTAPAGTQNVRFAETQDLSAEPWRDFLPQYTFELSPGDGTKTVWAQFIDAAGNLTEPVSSSIDLDTHAEITSLDFVTSAAPSDTIPPGGSVTFTIRTLDDEPFGVCNIFIEGMGATPLQAYDDGRNGDTVAGDGIYGLLYTFALSFRQRSMRMSADFTDAHGNTSVEVEFSRNMYMSDPPDSVSLQPITQTGPDSITLNWSRSTDDHFTAYKIYRRSTTPVDPVFSVLAGSVSDQSTTVFTDTGLTPNTTYWYSVYVVNDLDEGTGSAPRQGTTTP